MRAAGERVYVRLLEAEDAPDLLELRVRNRDFLRPWEPRRPGMRYTLEEQTSQLAFALESAAADRAYHFGIFVPAGELVGTITLSNVARRAWQNATIGYFVDEQHNGKGFATDAIRLVTRLAFTELGLHRVQAGVMPRNPASMRALEKAGYRREGLSLRYLHINDVWEDHVMFAITQEELDRR
ncbi:MAG: GNAT family N-acetyltransferase [Actinomycetota bacterium]|nr:GNAT family N-acetyltransferase [Actinomycetota bacterium]